MKAVTYGKMSMSLNRSSPRTVPLLRSKSPASGKTIQSHFTILLLSAFGVDECVSFGYFSVSQS